MFDNHGVKKEESRESYLGIPIRYRQVLPDTIQGLYGDTPEDAVKEYKKATGKMPDEIHELFGCFWGIRNE